MDSEVSGHSHLAPLLLGLWKAKNKTKQNKNHGGRAWRRKAAHIMESRKQRAAGRE
jgi:hypothetical protein